MRALKLIAGLISCGVIFFSLSSCSPVNNREEGTLIVGTNATYPPYEYIDDKGKCVGFDIDIAYAIGKKLNKKVVIKEFSFDALILGVKKKKIDFAIAGISITPERCREVHMSPYQGHVINHLEAVFWEKIPQDPLPLTQYPAIAVQVSTLQERFVQEQVEGSSVNVKSFDSTLELVMEIKFGKSAVTIMEPSVLKLLQTKFKELKSVSIPLPENRRFEGNGIVIAKDNVVLIEAIEQAVNELKEEGVIESLERKWLLYIKDN